MLSKDQVKKIATKLNEKVNIPLLREKRDQNIIERIINKLDDKLDEVAQKLPSNVKSIYDKISDGLTKEEAAQLTSELTVLANKEINIPLIGEDLEADLIIEPIIELIVLSLIHI